MTTQTTVFTIPGRPEPQRRARATTRGGHVRMIDDQRNRSYADRVRYAWRDAGADEHGHEPLHAVINARFPRPKGHWTSKGELSAAGRREPHCLNRVDVDNIGKAVLDALNGYAYADDRQVVDISVRKQWADNPTDDGAVTVCLYQPVDGEVA